jgi:hypothetical protein
VRAAGGQGSAESGNSRSGNSRNSEGGVHFTDGTGGDRDYYDDDDGAPFRATYSLQPPAPNG